MFFFFFWKTKIQSPSEPIFIASTSPLDFAVNEDTQGKTKNRRTPSENS